MPLGIDKESGESAMEMVMAVSKSDLYAAAKAGYATLDDESPSHDEVTEETHNHEVRTEIDGLLGQPKAPIEPHPASVCCTIFSLGGILFLTWIGALVSRDSIYIKIATPKGEKLSSLAGGIWGAVFLYAICFSVSGWYWYQAVKAKVYFQRNAEVHTAIDNVVAIPASKDAVLL